MVCHSIGPGKKRIDANVQVNRNIAIAWSEDLKTWHRRANPKTSANYSSRQRITWDERLSS
jgi:hypothetical protein